MLESHDASAEDTQPRREKTENAAHMVRHGTVPLTDETLGRLTGTAAQRWSEKECLVSLHQNVRLTFSDLIRRSDHLAAGLLKLGLKSGDCLAVWGPNDVEWVVSFLAAARAGFLLAAINPAYQKDELIYSIEKVGAKAAIAPEGFKTQNYPRMLLEAQRVRPALEHIIIYSKDHVT